jgi:hypothetical protein
MAVAGAITVAAAGEGSIFNMVPGGAVQGAVTGGALVWLLRQPLPEA